MAPVRNARRTKTPPQAADGAFPGKCYEIAIDIFPGMCYHKGKRTPERNGKGRGAAGAPRRADDEGGDFGVDMMSWVWLAVLILCGLAEAATAALVSIWFVGGAAAALLAALLKGPEWLQVVLFFLVSAVLLWATWPLARRMRTRAVATNLDRVLGRRARVVETIDDLAGTGAVYVEGKTWTARSGGEEVIPVGSSVTVMRMEGVKLFVREETPTPSWQEETG